MSNWTLGNVLPRCCSRRTCPTGSDLSHSLMGTLRGLNNQPGQLSINRKRNSHQRKSVTLWWRLYSPESWSSYWGGKTISRFSARGNLCASFAFCVMICTYVQVPRRDFIELFGVLSSPLTWPRCLDLTKQPSLSWCNQIRKALQPQKDETGEQSGIDNRYIHVYRKSQETSVEDFGSEGSTPPRVQTQSAVSFTPVHIRACITHQLPVPNYIQIESRAGVSTYYMCTFLQDLYRSFHSSSFTNPYRK